MRMKILVILIIFMFSLIAFVNFKKCVELEQEIKNVNVESEDCETEWSKSEDS